MYKNSEHRLISLHKNNFRRTEIVETWKYLSLKGLLVSWKCGTCWYLEHLHNPPPFKSSLMNWLFFLPIVSTFSLLKMHFYWSMYRTRFPLKTRIGNLFYFFQKKRWFIKWALSMYQVHFSWHFQKFLNPIFKRLRAQILMLKKVI